MTKYQGYWILGVLFGIIAQMQQDEAHYISGYINMGFAAVCFVRGFWLHATATWKR